MFDWIMGIGGAVTGIGLFAAVWYKRSRKAAKEWEDVVTSIRANRKDGWTQEEVEEVIEELAEALSATVPFFGRWLR